MSLGSGEKENVESRPTRPDWMYSSPVTSLIFKVGEATFLSLLSLISFHIFGIGFITFPERDGSSTPGHDSSFFWALLSFAFLTRGASSLDFSFVLSLARTSASCLAAASVAFLAASCKHFSP